jgi:hypothetical protein
MKYLVNNFEYELIIPFQYHMKSSIFVISQKNIWMKFFVQTKHKCDIEKKNCWKISVIWTITRIMLKTFVSKSILYVYQKVRWNQIKITLKIILNVLKNIHFLARNGLSIVCFHPTYIHANLSLDDDITIFWFDVNVKINSMLLILLF